MLALDNCYISTYLDKKSWSTSFRLETFAGTAGLCAQSKFLFKCLSTIKNWPNIVHININGEIRGRQHMPCVIKRCADTGRFFLYFLPCRLLFVVLPFEELNVAGCNISFYFIISPHASANWEDEDSPNAGNFSPPFSSLLPACKFDLSFLLTGAFVLCVAALSKHQ